MRYLKNRISRVVYVLFISSILLGCETNAQEVDLKENEAQRNAVYDQILNDEELFNDFMTRMMQHDQSMERMASHRQMMQQMHSGQNMQRMMRNHPEMMGNMMRGMMSAMRQDTTMMRGNPQMRQQMMENMMEMMQRDTTMYNQMHQRMQQNHMGGRNGMN